MRPKPVKADSQNFQPGRAGDFSAARFGLCCRFAEQPIKFRTTTVANLTRLQPADRRIKLSQICLANAQALMAALQYCAANDIGCFRIGSSILPVKTHPIAGYAVAELPDPDCIVAAFRRCGEFAAATGIRTTFHPDQFVVLNSSSEDVVDKSLQELEYQAEVAGWVGADVINVHAGGAYGDKSRALAAFARNVDRLSAAARSRLSVENDDRIYSPADLLPLCRATGLPFVYDVHHHRCHRDELTVEEATDAAMRTWNREPLFHVSSPRDGWNGARPERHHDYLDPAALPSCWRNLAVTIEVEAKSKELAVRKLQADLRLRRAKSQRRQRIAGAGR